MQLPSIILVLSAAISASAHPAATESSASLEPRRAAEDTDPTGRKSADFICNYSGNIAGQQLDEMTKLKASNISVPPYLAGYFSAVNSGRQAIGCPGTIDLRKRDFTPLQDPCDVLDEQHERMMELVDRFQKENIGVAPFLSGFLSATLDGHTAWGCPPFTGSAADAPVVDIKAATNDEDGASSG